MNLDRFNSYTIKMNLGFVYSMAIFFSFFVYGGVSNKYWFGMFLLPLIYFMANKLDLVIRIRLKILAATFLFGFVYLLLNNENASNPLVGDHLYHASVAYTIPLLIIKNKSQFLPEVTASKVLWFYSTGVVGFTILMAFIFGRSKKYFSVAIIFIGVLILSIAVIGGVANNDPHPPLRSYVLSLLGFIGVDSVVFRLQGLVPLLILTYWLIEKDGFNWQTAIILFFIYTIPVLFFNTLIVEFSIWTFAILTVFLLEADNNTGLSERKIILFAIAFTLLGLIRQTAAFGLVLLLINCMFQKNYKVLRWVLPISLPIVFQILKSLTNGTPATYVPAEVFLNIPVNIGLFERLLISLSSESYSQILATTGAPSLALVLFYFYRVALAKNIKLLTTIIIYLLMYWILFHMIRPILWGVPRYQLEYISPLVVAGFYYLIRFSVLIGRVLFVFFVSLNALFIFNAYYNIQIYKIDYPEYFKGETPYFSESIFNTEQAIRSSYNECNGNFKLGESMIENFPLILAGLSVREVSHSFSYSKPGDLKNYDSTLELRPIRCSLELVPGFFPGSFYNKTRNTSTFVKSN